ncbi:minor tail protein [Rhodococcus phage MacGully]|nr:minor tail protein [Rhodococcus phage MacGully]
MAQRPIIESGKTKLDKPFFENQFDMIESKYQSEMPSGLGWGLEDVAAPPMLEKGVVPASVASALAAEIFDRKSTARTKPGKTFWVAAGGSDSNAGTEVSPFGSLQKAVQAGNDQGVSALVNVVGNVFERSRSLYAASVAPMVDLALVARSGRVATGTFDLPSGWSTTPNSSYANTYTNPTAAPIANCDRVLDTRNLNAWGNYTELIKVPTPEACNLIPNSWALVSGTLYVHRMDELPVTTTNTKILRKQSFNLLVNSPINLWVEGFDFEGGPGNAARLDMGAAGPTAQLKAAVFSGCTFKYAGGYEAGSETATGLGAASWNGLVASFNCQSDANMTDGFNFHNGRNVPSPFSLTVNSAARDNGRLNSQSCNGLTYHESCIGMDFGGLYEANRGGSVRNIDSSKLLMVGSRVRNDKGDLGVGGGMPPTAIRIDGTSELWCDNVTVEMPRGQFAYSTGTGTAKIHRRNCAPVPQPDFGPGVFDTY